MAGLNIREGELAKEPYPSPLPLPPTQIELTEALRADKRLIFIKEMAWKERVSHSFTHCYFLSLYRSYLAN